MKVEKIAGMGAFVIDFTSKGHSIFYVHTLFQYLLTHKLSKILENLQSLEIANNVQCFSEDWVEISIHSIKNKNWTHNHMKFYGWKSPNLKT